MKNSSDVLKYLDFIKEINDNYLMFKNDSTNQELYYKIKGSLERLGYLIDNNLLPSNLCCQSEKFYCDIYRKIERIYTGKKVKRK